jgi:predicted HTH transcriptional regulator
LESVEGRFPNGLKLQCIPEDPELWKIGSYEEFLGVRRKMLANELNAFLKNITETKPSETPVTLEELIAEGEDDELEFKSSLRWDFGEGKVNKRLEDVVVKTIAAFANGQGGTLLIGVKDDGEILGLEGDFHALGGADRDQFEVHLRNVLNTHFGTSFVTNKLHIAFPSVQDVEICQLDIALSQKPIIITLKDKNGQEQEKFYVRSGNSSQELSLNEMQSYMTERFPK